MFSCKQVTQIVSESLDKKLPFWTRVQLRMHLAMCGLCSRFRKTMIRVDREVNQRAEEIERNVGDDESKLSADARDRIQRAMRTNGR